MNNPPSRKNRFELESLEPRLLLSGDGFAGVLASGILADSDQPNDAIIVEHDISTSLFEQASEEMENDIFGIEDECFGSVEEASEEGQTDAVAVTAESPDAEEAVAPETVAVDANRAVDSAPSGEFCDSLKATSLSGHADTLSEELVTTLNAANAPPASADPLNQWVAAEFTISGSDTAGGSGFDVSASDGSNLLLIDASGTASNADSADTLTTGDLEILFEEARRQWSEATLSADQVERLNALTLEISNLPIGVLGKASDDKIILDTTAAGRGWFIDATPADSNEFELLDGRLMARADSDAFGRIDLLSVLHHEIGHVLGHGHDSGLAVMDAELKKGERVLFSSEDVSAVTTSANAASISDNLVTVNADINWALQNSGLATEGNVLDDIDHDDPSEVQGNETLTDYGDNADEDGDLLTVTWIQVEGESSVVVAPGTTSADGMEVVGKYGTLTIGADGSYSYLLDD